MLKTHNVLLLLSIFLLFTSCEDKEVTEPAIENPMIYTLDINDITPTDANGALLGNPDNTDWTLDEEWSGVIESLFDDHDDYDYDCSLANDINIYPAYPNPGNGIFSLSMQIPEDSKVSFEFVNKYATSLNEINDITSGPLTINAQQFVPDQDSFVRVYYLLSTSDNCGFRGHGDIQLK